MTRELDDFSRIQYKNIQLNPALTDFRELNHFICYKWDYVIVNIGNKKLGIKIKDEYLLQAEFR